MHSIAMAEHHATARACTTHPLPRIERWSLPTARGIPLPAFATRFNASDFDPIAFQACAIPEPLQVAKSVHRRRAEYFYGRLAGKAALAELGLGHASIPTGPFREPVWPRDVVGSISHNDQRAIATAVPATTWMAVGLDIETIHDSASSALSREVIVDDERRALEGAHLPWSTAQRLTIVFSAKESFFKAAFTQVGRYFDFDAALVREIDPSLLQLQLEVREDLAPALRRGHEVMVQFSLLDSCTVLTWCAW